MKIDQKMRQFAVSDLQWERYVTAKELGQRPAARKLKCDQKAIWRAVTGIEKRAAIAGYSPDHDMTHTTPPGFNVRGVSTLYGDDGSIKAQWVKTQQDREAQLEAYRETLEVLAEGIKPLKATKPPKGGDADLLTVYPFGDPHIGMYAWAKESGEDFDCDIARQDLFNAMSYLTQNTPPSKTGLIINLGDFYHADDNTNSTKRSGNILDVDTRWPRVLELGFLAMVDCIDLARKKHDRVEVINAIGNHDDHSSVMLALCLKAWYRNEPRVHVHDTAAKHHYTQHGKVLIGVTHGDTAMNDRKRRDLAAVMANDRPKEWGETTKRYWYTGHIHSSNKMELVGAMWESFRNLAPNDAWHQGEGYRSGRDMQAITLHSEHGEVSRITCDISMVRS